MMRGNLSERNLFPRTSSKKLSRKKERLKIHETRRGDHRSSIFCVFEMYFLTTKSKYCIIKGRKRVLLWYGIFLVDIFICISAGGVADLFCGAPKREEPSTFSLQSFLLCVGRADLRATHACIPLACVSVWCWNREVASRKTAKSQSAYYTFGVCEPLIFVLF